MLLPPNFPLYKATMEAYSTKPAPNFDLKNNEGFKKAISEALEKAMDDKSTKAVFERHRALERLNEARQRYASCTQSLVADKAQLIQVEEIAETIKGVIHAYLNTPAGQEGEHKYSASLQVAIQSMARMPRTELSTSAHDVLKMIQELMAVVKHCVESKDEERAELKNDVTVKIRKLRTSLRRARAAVAEKEQQLAEDRNNARTQLSTTQGGSEDSPGLYSSTETVYPSVQKYENLDDPWNYALAKKFEKHISNLQGQLDESLLVKYGHPLLEHHPNFAEKVDKSLQNFIDFGRPHKYNRIIMRMLDELLRLPSTRDSGQVRTVYDESKNTYDLSNDESFLKFVSIREFLIRQNSMEDGYYDREFVNVHLFLLVAEQNSPKIFWKDRLSEFIVPGMRNKPRRRETTPSTSSGSTQDPSSSEKTSSTKSVHQRPTDPSSGGSRQSREDLDELSETARTLRYPISTPVRTSDVHSHWTDKIVETLNEKAHEEGNEKTEKLLKSVAKRLVKEDSFKQASEDPDPTAAMETEIMRILDPREISEGTVLDYPADIFDDFDAPRVIYYKGSIGLGQERGNLSLTNDALLTFVKLRKYLMQTYKNTMYMTKPTTNVRLFVLVVERVGIHVKGVTVYHENPRPDTRFGFGDRDLQKKSTESYAQSAKYTLEQLAQGFQILDFLCGAGDIKKQVKRLYILLKNPGNLEGFDLKDFDLYDTYINRRSYLKTINAEIFQKFEANDNDCNVRLFLWVAREIGLTLEDSNGDDVVIIPVHIIPKIPDANASLSSLFIWL
ncbi:unnamed protein product [Ectocarpus sp. 12 AP-2014]